MYIYNWDVKYFYYHCFCKFKKVCVHIMIQTHFCPKKKKKDVNTLVFVAIYILEMRKCLLLNFDMRLDLEK